MDLIGYFNRATGQNSFVAGTSNNALATDNSIALGRGSAVRDNDSIAIGTDADTLGIGGVAVGTSIDNYGNNSTSVGHFNVLTGDQASSLGNLAYTGGDGATSIGSESWANAQNATTLGYNAQTGGENAVRIGAQSAGSGSNSVVIGSHSTGTAEDVVLLGSGGMSGVGTTIADDKNSVAIGYGSDTDGEGAGNNDTVSFGGSLGGSIRTVSQVANGMNDQDAINVSQLNDAIAGLTSGAELLAHADDSLTKEKADREAGDTALQANIDDEAAKRLAADNAEKQARIDGDAALQSNIDDEAATRLAADNTEKQARIDGDAAEAAARTAAINTEKQARIDGDAVLQSNIDVEAATRASEVKRLDGRIDQTNRRLDRVETTAYRGVAISLAAAQAIPSIQPGQVAVFGGAGYYEGEAAGAVGVVSSFSNRFSGSGAVGVADGGKFGGRAGVAYVFGGN